MSALPLKPGELLARRPLLVLNRSTSPEPPAPDLFTSPPPAPTPQKVRKMEQFPRSSSRDREASNNFRDTPVMMTLASFRKPTSIALPKARELILKWAEEQHGKLPEGALEGHAFDLDRPGDPLRVITPTTDPNLYWALRLNRVDHDVAGRIWTVEAHLASSGAQAHFGFRMSVLSEGGHLLRAPRFIRELDQAIGLEIDGLPLDGRERFLRPGSSTDAILNLIEYEKRALPVVVFSTNKATGSAREGAAKSLAKMARGIAHVFVIDEEVSFQFTRRFGKALSCFNGAIRVYPPNFSHHGDPFSMPLYLTTRIERVQDNRLADWLMNDVCGYSCANFHNDTLPRFSTLRKTQARYELGRAKNEAASSTTNSAEQVQALQTQIAKFGELENLFNESLAAAEQEASQARMEADEFRSDNYRLRAHVESLLEALRAEGRQQAEVPIPDSFEDLQTWADQYYPTSITISNKAARLAASGTFEDVPTAYKALQLLATEYRDSKRGVEGANDRFEKGLQDLGLQITPAFANGSAHNSGSDAVLLYRGRKHVLDWHIKNGGNTRDPTRCLRIYFFWSDEDQVCVVGALPAHIRTILS